MGKGLDIELCQLIKYSVRNIFMEKSCKKRAQKASLRPILNFHKLPKTAIAY